MSSFNLHISAFAKTLVLLGLGIQHFGVEGQTPSGSFLESLKALSTSARLWPPRGSHLKGDNYGHDCKQKYFLKIDFNDKEKKKENRVLQGVPHSQAWGPRTVSQGWAWPLPHGCESSSNGLSPFCEQSASSCLETDIAHHPLTARPRNPGGEKEMRLDHGMRGFCHTPQHIRLWARAIASHVQHCRQLLNKTISMGLLLAQPWHSALISLSSK